MIHGTILALTAFGWFGLVVSAIVNLAAIAWLAFVILQIQAIRKGKLDKNDPSVIGAAKQAYENYFEKKENND